MSFVPTNDVKERIRQATDIVDLVSSSISLRRQGRNFVGICLWHNDSKPSLQVNPVRQTWKCWVCDIGGDVFSYVMQREGVDFREAMQMLADRVGITIESHPQPQAAPGSPDDKRTLYNVLAWAERLFQECLLKSPEAEPARKYLVERNISVDSIQRFHLGFSPNKWNWLLERARSANISMALLEATDLVAKWDTGYYDRFKGRVMFPIRDVQSRPIAFGGRVLPQFATITEEEARGKRAPAKYVNSRETKVFSKSDQLYLLDVAREHVTTGDHSGKARDIIVVEGYTDAIVAHQFGFQNVVAVLGTALNERHIRLLRRFVDSVTLLLDGDEAGQRRTNEILELFVATQMDLRILTLPEEFDPAEFLEERGAEPFRVLLGQTVDALEHKIRTATRGIDLNRDTHRANQALEEILSTIAKAPRSPLDTTQSHEQRKQLMFARLAREFLLTEGDLRTRINEMRKKNESRPSVAESVSSSPSKPKPNVRQLDARERELFEILTQHPELVAVAVRNIETEQLPSHLGKELFTFYMRMQEEGESVEFAHLLGSFEDPHMQNLLVELDERAQEKAGQTQEKPEQRLHLLLRDFQDKRKEVERRGQLAALEKRHLNEKEELSILQQLIADKRERQGIPAPTDG